jgi:hypothetical protein
VSRVGGIPLEIELSGVDEQGRELQVTGRRRNTLANHATPSSFAWMSMFEWRTEAGVIHGQDQEVWTPDRLGRPLLDLDRAPSAGS